jgi:hypothetical protein
VLDIDYNEGLFKGSGHELGFNDLRIGSRRIHPGTAPHWCWKASTISGYRDQAELRHGLCLPEGFLGSVTKL